MALIWVTSYLNVHHAMNCGFNKERFRALIEHLVGFHLIYRFKSNGAPLGAKMNKIKNATKRNFVFTNIAIFVISLLICGPNLLFLLVNPCWLCQHNYGLEIDDCKL